MLIAMDNPITLGWLLTVEKQTTLEAVQLSVLGSVSGRLCGVGLLFTEIACPEALEPSENPLLAPSLKSLCEQD